MSRRLHILGKDIDTMDLPKTESGNHDSTRGLGGTNPFYEVPETILQTGEPAVEPIHCHSS